MIKRLLLSALLLLFNINAYSATEKFYLCHGGDGSLPETNACATAYDEADFNNAANWDVDDQDDGKIGPNDTVVLLDGGGDFTSTLTINSSGLSGKPITITGSGSPVIDATAVDYGIYGNEKNYITIDGVECKNAIKSGIFMSAAGGGTTSNNWIVQNCILHDNTKCGFDMQGAGGSSNSTIQDNTIYSNGEHGVSFRPNGNITGWTVKNNTVYDNALIVADSSGIKPYGATITSCTIENNTVYSENHGGIWVDTCGTGMVVRYNNIRDCAKHGIWIEKTSGAKVYYNLVYDNTNTTSSLYGNGIKIGYDADSNLIYNNTVYNCVYGIRVYGYYDAASEPCGDGSQGVFNNLIKNNIVYGSITHAIVAYLGGHNDGTCGSGNVYTYNSLGVNITGVSIDWGMYENDATYTTYATWQAAAGCGVGVCDNQIEADPLLRNPASGNVELMSFSPCRDTGDNVGLSYDYDGTWVPRFKYYDIGAQEYYKPFKQKFIELGGYNGQF